MFNEENMTMVFGGERQKTERKTGGRRATETSEQRSYSALL